MSTTSSPPTGRCWPASWRRRDMSGARDDRPATPVYLDYQATTPVDPRVLDAMLPYFTRYFGNPHSGQHGAGRQSAEAVERARAQVAELIGATPREIVFTSGATESNNIAIKGVARFHKGRGDHIVNVATEHKCVLESAARMKAEGYRVTTLPVQANGLVTLDRLASAVEETTVLVSVMAANNEIGIIQPLAEIGALCHERGVAFHTDAAQAVGKIPIDVEAMAIDLLSISGHKVYGPKGIGALYVRRRPRMRLTAEMDGGGQERGMRSGTVPTPLCVGMGEAAAVAGEEMGREAPRLVALRDRFLARLEAALPAMALNGDRERRLPGNLNVTFPGLDAETLMAEVDDLALATGSACTSATVEPSYVLRALGLPEALARASVRIGLGRFTTEAELDYAAERLIAAVRRLTAAAAE